MKKYIAIVLAAVLLLVLLPMTALAATYTLSDGQTLDLSSGAVTLISDGSSVTTYTLAAGDLITVDPDAAVTLTGAAPANFRVSCGSGVTLTIDGVTIDNSGLTIAARRIPIAFSGTGNTLVLKNESTLKAGGYYGWGDCSAVRVLQGVSLEISEDAATGGTLNAYGGYAMSAAIGSYDIDDNDDSGEITITSGTIYAYGGLGGAGIGAGPDGVAGNITITGGAVYAYGGQGAAGIGNGVQTFGYGGIISISGGTVTAEGGTATATGIGGAGIGGGAYTAYEEIRISGDAVVTATGGGYSPGIGSGYQAATTGSVVNISGGTVTATGGSDGGAGIGGGAGASVADTINVTGGTVTAIGTDGGAGIGCSENAVCGDITLGGAGMVYAQAGSSTANDIGCGDSGSSGTLAITDTVAVFLGSDSYLTPTLTVPHVHKLPSDTTDPLIFDGNTVYGLTAADYWRDNTAGGFFILPVLTYDANGGTGTVPTSLAQHVNTTVTVADDSTISYSGYTFSGWNTQADGTGTPYAAGAVLALDSDMTLYAQWKSPTVVIPYYTLSFETNGGNEISSVTKAYGITVDLSGYEPTRSGFIFDGWYSDSDLTDEITAIKMTSNKTVYAGWVSDSNSDDSADDLNSDDHFAYIYGYEDGTVRPEGNITRAESATVIYRLLTSDRRDEIFTSNNAFDDVSKELWYNKAVSSMANGGYIDGYEDGNFKGDNAITRAEFVAVLARFIGVDASTVDFDDISQEHWACDYIATAVNAGWITGYTNGSFLPDQYITRAEAVTIINRVLDRGVDEDSDIPGGIIDWPDNNSDAWYYYEVIEATNDHAGDGERPSENWTSLEINYTYDMAYYENP